MSLKYLNLSGLEDLWINIKNYILSKIPTKTSELTNDSGYLTSHQSLDNYVTLNTSQTITAIKVITGGNQGKMLFKNPNYTKGDAVESGTTISRLYFGNGASYDGANGVLTTDINSAGNTSMELCAMNNTASNSNRASLILTYDKSATRPRMLKSWGDFIPYSNNNYTLGNTSNIWKECYCNAYYLGTSAFGDIVTHNASEFLTEHQSLANYALDANVVHTSGDETIAGKKSFNAMPSILGSYLGNEYSTNARTCLYLKSNRDTDGQSGIYFSKFRQNRAQGALTGSDLVDLSLDVLENSVRTNSCISISFRYFENDVPTKIYFIPKASVTSYMGTANNPWTNIYGTNIYGSFTGNLTGDVTGNASSATEFSANQDVTLTGDVTGTASSKAGWSVATTLANSGVTAGTYGPSANVTGSNNATILVPQITVDAKGRVTSVTNRTYTSVNTDTNTDTKVTQTVTTANSGYPVLLCATANATATETTTSRFSAGLTVNTRYSSIYMSNKYDTANTKGVRNKASYSNGILYFRSYDDTQMGLIRCDSHKSGYQHIYMQASNYIKNGAISPEGTATTCSIAVRVRDNGSKTIYTDGSWENSLIPYANNTHSLGTSTNKWKSFNGLEPSSLSLPDINNRIDISSYITNLSGVGNVYTPTVNGWICVRSANATKISILDFGTSIGNSTISNTATYLTVMAPVVANRKVSLNITCTSLMHAYFIPCQGNV